MRYFGILATITSIYNIVHMFAVTGKNGMGMTLLVVARSNILRRFYSTWMLPRDVSRILFDRVCQSVTDIGFKSTLPLQMHGKNRNLSNKY